jgi:Family of unknown function (DUF6220)
MRAVFAVIAWVFVAAIVVQVFLAGVGLFVPGIDTFSAHRALGWMLHLGPIVVILAAWAAHPGPTTMWLSGALLLLVGIQPFLPAMRTDLPLAAALHPVNALAIFWVAILIARRATVLARSAPAMPAASAVPEAST